MKVYFIGAGPGAPDLITVRGARILGVARLVLYAGSLVPRAMLEQCRADAELVDTAGLDLDQQEAQFRRARDLGWDVARLHSGDPSIYGAIAEQMTRLERLGIECEVVPGVSSFTASAAALRRELTRPGLSQTVILARREGRTPVPQGQSLDDLARHRATLCLFLSGDRLADVVAELLPHYGAACPVALVHRASWPDERRHASVLGRLLDEIDPADWTLSTMVLVGEALAGGPGEESRLYAADFSHGRRRGNKP